MFSALRPKPNLEHLDERLVPATLIDLTHAGDQQSVTDTGAIVQQCDAQPTGTGYIRSFVRVQGAASGGGTEQGYNTDGRPLQFDENKSPQFTRSLTLGQVPIVNVGGTEYRQFLLDINQKASAPILSMDEVRVFLGGAGNLTSYNVAAKTLDGQAAVFDLDSGGDVSVMLNYRLNSGSGSGDMYLLVPNSAFAGGTASSFVYLFSKFGGEADASANAGFEEWAVRSAPVVAPIGTGSLSGRVFLDRDRNGLFDGTDVGLAGVVVKLQGVDDLGQTVVLTVTTDVDGNYSFTGLRAGKYTMWEEQPVGLIDGFDYLGEIVGADSSTWGSDAVDDKFADIMLGTGQHGVNYLFTEWEQPPE